MADSAGASTETADRLPFDLRTEIDQFEAYRKLKGKHFLLPQLPAIALDAELHCPAIHMQFTRWFETTQMYAVFLDVVARHWIRAREDYNGYLVQFDEHIAHLSGQVSANLTKYETLSEGQLTRHRNPYKVAIEISGPRGKQILDCFLGADRLLRHGQFLAIMGEIDGNELRRLEDETVRSLSRTSNSLRSLVIEAKQRVTAARTKSAADREVQRRRDVSRRAARRRDRAEEPLVTSTVNLAPDIEVPVLHEGSPELEASEAEAVETEEPEAARPRVSRTRSRGAMAAE